MSGLQNAPDSDEDAHLVRQLVLRDVRALETLYNRHSRALLALARNLSSDSTLAEDVVQDVFVWLWFHPGRFDASRGSLRGFLILQARSRAIDLVRSREARKERELRHLSALPASAAAAESLAMRRDRERLVRDALHELCDAERTAIELAFLHGLTYRKVAEALNVPEGTVKSRIRSGLRRLVPVLVDAETSPP